MLAFLFAPSTWRVIGECAVIGFGGLFLVALILILAMVVGLFVEDARK